MKGYIKCGGYYLTSLLFMGMMPLKVTDDKTQATKYSHDTYLRIKQTHAVEWEPI